MVENYLSKKGGSLLKVYEKYLFTLKRIHLQTTTLPGGDKNVFDVRSP